MSSTKSKAKEEETSDSEEDPAIDDSNDADYEVDSDDSEDCDEDDDGATSCSALLNEDILFEVKQFLESKRIINYENALEVNREMQKRLIELRYKIEDILHAIRERYRNNEHYLKTVINQPTYNGIGVRGARLVGKTFYFQGSMFFRDDQQFCCPNNEDYEQRKADGEMFPMDFDLRPHHTWTLLDKVRLIYGIKEQAIQHLMDSGTIPKIDTLDKKKRKDTRFNNLVHKETLCSLLQQVNQDFCIDWHEISVIHLESRHNPMTCAAMWKMYLHPSFNHSGWTDEENERLLKYAKECNFQNWRLIGTKVRKRSEYQCFVQYQTCVRLMNPHRHRKWQIRKKENDELLVRLVERYTENGVVNWNHIYGYFPNVAKTTLQQRYWYKLDPKLNHAPFTTKEDMLLLACVEKYGTNFKLFPKRLFPNRSVLQLRHRYNNVLLTRSKSRPWTMEDDNKLMQFIMERGTSAWKECAQTIGNHSRFSCRTRYVVIKKFFDKNPGATIRDLPRRAKRPRADLNAENWIEKVKEFRKDPSKEFKYLPVRQEAKLKAKLKKPKEEEPAKALVPSRRERLLEAPKQRLVMNRKPVNYLRGNELAYYEYLKFAYNFNIHRDFDLRGCFRDLGGLRHVQQVLRFDHRGKKKFNQDINLSKINNFSLFSVLKHLKYDPKEASSHCLLAPNYSTAIGLRALCIHVAQTSDGDTQEPPKKKARISRKLEHKPNDHYKPEKVQDQVALSLFRQRLESLFLDTLLLCHMSPPQDGVVKLEPPEAPCVDANGVIEIEEYSYPLNDIFASESDQVDTKPVIDEVAKNSISIPLPRSSDSNDDSDSNTPTAQYEIIEVPSKSQARESKFMLVPSQPPTSVSSDLQKDVAGTTEESE